MEDKAKGQLVADILDLRYNYGGHVLIAKVLDEGADANEADSGGMTPLMAVARNCGTSEIRLLLERGADPRLADMFGDTALHFAATSQMVDDGVELLIAAGANIHAANNLGMTPLHEAAANAKWTGVAVTNCLLRHGADPSARDEKGKRPFNLAKDKPTKGLLKAAYEQRQMTNDPGIKPGTLGEKPWRSPRP